jgi:NitT/TauT family transport system substrate-binding protein
MNRRARAPEYSHRDTETQSCIGSTRRNAPRATGVGWIREPIEHPPVRGSIRSGRVEPIVLWLRGLRGNPSAKSLCLCVSVAHSSSAFCLRPSSRFMSVVSLVSLVLMMAACGRPADTGRTRVRVAIGGQNQLVYLPTTLAHELGLYAEEGLDVDLQDFAGGSKALQALMGGSADVVSGFYDHTIQMAAEGRELVAFVTMLRFPGLVLVTSPQAAASVTKIEDLKGRIAGVTTAGSSSQMLLTYLLQRHGVAVDTVSVTAIGSAATAIAAIEHGKVDVAMVADPAFTLVTRRNPSARVLADLRTAAGVKAAIDAETYPASVLYAPADWIAGHRETSARLARAIRRTLQWMQAHSAEEIAAKTPKSLRGEDDALYVEALKSSMAMFSPDGVMTADGARAVRTLLAAAMDKVRSADIDVTKTYTNEFVDGR